MAIVSPSGISCSAHPIGERRDGEAEGAQDDQQPDALRLPEPSPHARPEA